MDIEKAIQDHEKGVITFAQVQKRSNQTFDIKKQTELSYHEYIEELEDFNKLVDDSQVLYKDWLNKIQDQDELRVDATKTCLKKFFNTFEDLGEIITEKLSEAISSVDQMNPQTDIRIFIDENRSQKEFYKKKEFISFDYSKKMIQNKRERLNSGESLEDFIDFGRSQSVDSPASRNSIGVSSSKTFEDNSGQEEHDLLGLDSIQDLKEERKETDDFNSNKDFVKHAIEGLFTGKELSKDDQLKVFELIHEDYISAVLSNHLNAIKSPRRIENVEILKCLAEIIKYLITVSIHDKQNDFNIVLSVLGCSQYVYAIDNISMRKILLTHLIKNHGIWQDISKWILWIYKVIENKRQEFNERRKSMNYINGVEEPSKRVGSRLFGGIKGLGRYVLGKGTSEDEAQNEAISKNLIFNVLSQFVYHFANFGVSLKGGKKLVLYFCEKYSIPKVQVHTVLTELEAVSRRGGQILTETEKMMIPMLKRNERLKKYGHDNNTMVLGLVIPYIGDDTTCINILKACRVFNEVLKDKVYKHCLLHTDKKPLNYSKRCAIWSFFLRIKENVIEYEALKNKINDNPELIESVSEVITLDVNRSYTNIKNLDQVGLKNILRTYAFYNSEVRYCQGMNFLAGFLLMFYRDENIAFKAFSGLIEVNNMGDLFKDDLPLLKQYFYKLDRLISMYLPDLYSHFKDETVQASLFGASWFITLFANTIQFQKSEVINEALLKLWDYFVVFGYEGVFRASIFLLKTFEPIFYQLSFEQILAFIPQTPRFIFTPNEEEEDLSNEEMIKHLLSASVQNENGIITQKIIEIRAEIDSTNNLHHYLMQTNIPSFILEKIDTEYYESEKHSEIDNYLNDTE